MAAMEVTLSCMVKQRAPPVTETTGGTSKGSPGAGGDDIVREHPPGPTYRRLTAGDRAGAVLLTVLTVTGLVVGMVWILLDESSDDGPPEQCKRLYSAAAALHRVKGNGEADKEQSAMSSGSERGLRSASGNGQAMEEAPVMAGRARSESQVHVLKRASGVPIGAPHKVSVRPGSDVDARRSGRTSPRNRVGAASIPTDVPESSSSKTSK